MAVASGPHACCFQARELLLRQCDPGSNHFAILIGTSSTKLGHGNRYTVLRVSACRYPWVQRYLYRLDVQASDKRGKLVSNARRKRCWDVFLLFARNSADF